MSEETNGELSKKRKRADKTKQGPTSSGKRRRAEVEDELVYGDLGMPGLGATDASKAPAEEETHPSEVLSSLVKDDQKISKRQRNRTKTRPAVVTEQKYPGWTLAAPRGGTYLKHDPRFTADGRYLVAAKEHELQVLSLEHSLIHKRIPAAKESKLRAFALSRTDSSQVHIAWSAPSRVEVWDWEADEPAMIRQEKTVGECRGITLVTDSGKTEERLVQLAQSGDTHTISIGNHILHETSVRLTSILATGNVVVAFGPHHLLLGVVDLANPDASRFAEFSIQARLVSLAVRRQRTHSQKKQKSATGAVLSMALGSDTGEIFIYDAVNVSIKAETPALPTPRILHWHRTAVRAVEWSRDGNYLISGGSETVMVIWQLTTARKQFLPHLSATIDNITVSGAGSSYALQLADNSIMVLSTSELKPIAHFPDLQNQLSAFAGLHNRKKDSASAQASRLAGCLHPLHGEELLFAVPPNITVAASKAQAPARPFLLSFDLKQHRYNYRQALTRNHMTDLNTGPEGKPLQEPDVHSLRISHDGRFMATVETWTPPKSDYDFLALDKKIAKAHVRLYREVHLKIWRWLDTKNSWGLQERFTNPHPASDGGEPGAVLDLISDPSCTRFFTVGQDHTIRSWTPRVQSDTSSEWASRTIARLTGTSLIPSSGNATSSSIHGRLAISPDASLLAASLGPLDASETHIHLLPTTDAGGRIIQALPPITGELHSLAFHDRFLSVATSITLTTIDLPRLSPVFTQALPHYRSDVPLARRHRHLAVSSTPSSSLVAISLPVKAPIPAADATLLENSHTKSDTDEPHTRIEIWDYLTAKVRFRTVLRGVVTGLFALAPGNEAGGEAAPARSRRDEWVVLTADARVLRVLAPASAPRLSAGLLVGADAGAAPQQQGDETTGKQGIMEAVVEATMDKDAEGVDTEGEDAPLALAGGYDGDDDDDDDVEMEDVDNIGLVAAVDENPVVRPEQLAELFAGPRGGLLNMPVRAMFQGVMGMFASKPVGVTV